MANTATLMNFGCGKILLFPTANSHRCYWSNSSVLVIRDTVEEELTVGSLLALNASACGNTLQVACDALGVRSCPSTSCSPGRTIVVGAPARPIAPLIGSFSPAVVGSCNSWQLDFSTVSGNAGRVWKNTTFSMVGSVLASNTSAIVRELRSQFAGSTVVTLPSNMLVTGEMYLVAARFCNFLSACSSRQIATAIANSSLNVPPIALIYGAQTRTIFANETLSVTSDGYVMLCDGARRYSGLQYSWFVRNSTHHWAVATSSKDPRKLLLSAFTLPSDQLYTVALNVKDSANPSRPQATCNISLQVSPVSLVAALAPSSADQQLRVDGYLVLNASTSYDPTNTRNKLSYKWSCATLSSSTASAVVLPSCAVVLSQSRTSNISPASATSAVYVTAANASSLGTRSRIDLVVYDPSQANRANGTAHVFVTVIASAAPLISFAPTVVASRAASTSPTTPTASTQTTTSLSSGSSFVNIDDKLSFYSTILSPSACNASWEADDAALRVESLLASDYAKIVPANRLTNVNLHLLENVLVGSATYVFTLSCSVDASAGTRRSRRLKSQGWAIRDSSAPLRSSVSITINTNSPPKNGRLSVLPSEGSALNTSFTLSTSMWVDTDLPLLYSFSFLSDRVYMPLMAKSELSSISALLPSLGNAGGASSTLNLSVVAEDCFGSRGARAFTGATVLPMAKAAVTAYVTQLFATTGTANMTTDQMQNVISAATSMLNIVDCSGAPNCTALHRTACRSTENTCGPCQAGFMTAGDQGDANSQCTSTALVRDYASYVQKSCTSASSCAPWQTCNVTSQCSNNEKTCSSPTCSGHGSCTFLDASSGAILRSCMQLSSSCEAMCRCNVSYGGASCSLTMEALQAEQDLRATLLGGLADMMSSSDLDASSLSSAAESMSSLIRDEFDVSAESSSMIASLAQTILSQSSLVSNPNVLDVATMLASVDAALSALQSGLLTNASSAISQNLTSVVYSFQNLLVQQQQSFNVVYDSFRLSSYVLENAGQAFSNPNGTISASVALTDEERVLQSIGLLSLPAVTVKPPAQTGNTSSGVIVAIVLMDRKYFANASMMDSDVITVLASNVESVDVTFVPTIDASSTVGIAYSITCPPRIQVRKNFTCPDSGAVMRVQCNGTAGTMTGMCPVRSPVCSSMSVGGAGGGISDGTKFCVAVNTTSKEMTCRCELALDGGVGIVAAGLVVRFVGSDLSRTFRASSAFTDSSTVSNTYIIIAIYAGLWTAALLALLHSSWSRRRVTKQQLNKVGLCGTALLPDASSTAAAAIASGEVHTAGKSSFDRQAARHKLEEYIAMTIPAVFKSRTIAGAVLHELRRHHQYVKFFFRLQHDHAPLLVVVKMITIQSLILFLLALLYDLNYPDDDGSCVSKTTIEDCLERKYIMDNKKSYCQWTSVGDDYVCSYAEPSFSLTAAMYVSIFISLGTGLALEPLENLVLRLGANTAKPTSSKNRMKSRVHSSRQLIPAEELPSPVFARSLASPPSPAAAASSAGQASSMLNLVPVGEEAVRPAVATKEDSRPGLFRSVASMRSIPTVTVVAHDEIALFGRQASMQAQARTERRKSMHAETLASKLDASMGTGVLSRKTFAMFQQELRLQRELLPPDAQVNFDRAWALQGNGCEFAEVVVRSWWGRPREVIHAKALVKDEFLSTQHEAEKLQRELLNASDVDRGFELLHCFVKDLLGRHSPAARIFAIKVEEDFQKVGVASRWEKILIGLFIAALNGFFMYYTLLKGNSKGLRWQQDFLMAWAVQIALDIAIFETLQCLWIHQLMPSLVAREVNHAYRVLQRTVEHLFDAAYYDSALICLNAPEYFFVSHRVADAFPHLIESALIKTYCTHLPEEAGGAWQQAMHRAQQSADRSPNPRERVARSFVVRLLTQSAARFPLALQRLILRIAEPLILSGMTLALVHFIRRPLYLLIIGAAIVLILLALLWDYFRATPRQAASEAAAQSLELLEAARGRDCEVHPAPAEPSPPLNESMPATARHASVQSKDPQPPPSSRRDVAAGNSNGLVIPTPRARPASLSAQRTTGSSDNSSSSSSDSSGSGSGSHSTSEGESESGSESHSSSDRSDSS